MSCIPQGLAQCINWKAHENPVPETSRIQVSNNYIHCIHQSMGSVTQTAAPMVIYKMENTLKFQWFKCTESRGTKRLSILYSKVWAKYREIISTVAPWVVWKLEVSNCGIKFNQIQIYQKIIQFKNIHKHSKTTRSCNMQQISTVARIFMTPHLKQPKAPRT